MQNHNNIVLNYDLIKIFIDIRIFDNTFITNQSIQVKKSSFCFQHSHIMHFLLRLTITYMNRFLVTDVFEVFIIGVNNK